MQTASHTSSTAAEENHAVINLPADLWETVRWSNHVKNTFNLLQQDASMEWALPYFSSFAVKSDRSSGHKPISLLTFRAYTITIISNPR